MKRSKWFITTLLVGFCVVGLLQTARAAIVPSGDADPYYPGPFGWTLCLVGNSGTGSLTIDDDSDLDSTGGSLGVESSASGTVTVTDAGSTWNNAISVSVGCEGTGILNITNGGAVIGGDGYVGSGENSTGIATVNGIGSLWTSENLNIGRLGSGTLNITTGGCVNSEDMYLGNDAGSTGIATVNGDNTILTASSSLRIGNWGSGTLEIIDGGTVNSGASYIGSASESTGLVTVNGISSTWTSTDDLYVGYNGNGTLNIINGGAVTVGGMTQVACYDCSTGTIHFDNGTLTTQSLRATQDQLTGTGTVNTSSLGTLLSDNDIVFNATTGPCYTTLLENQTNQHITVNADLSTSNTDLYVGYASSGSLTISEGIVISATAAYLGYQTGSSGTLNVTDENSQLTVSGGTTDSRDFYIGYEGNGALHITNGGNVTNQNSSHLGYVAGSSGSATVDGAGSKWSAGSLYVGYRGSGTLEITSGGEVSDYYGYVNYLSSSPCSVTVNGEGSKWTNTSTLYVGHRGTGSLVVSAGGKVTSSGGSIGYRSSEVSSVTITGPGSTWINSSSLSIGGSSCYSGNGSLEITNGGFVSSTSGSIGTFTNSTGSVIVTGENSTWTISGGSPDTTDLDIGGTGVGTLEIADGGTISNFNTFLGGSTPGSSATVTGTGSTWTIAQDFHIGGNVNFDGHGTLSIANGGEVTVGNMTWVSLRADSTGSIHFDNGTLSTKTLCASSTQLTGTGTINARGLVADGNFVFDSAGDTVQSFIVENQPGEQVTVNLDLSNPSDVGALGMGYKGNGTLAIRQGVTVNSSEGWLGLSEGSTGAVSVSGSGTTWNNSGHLYVGGNGYVFYSAGGNGALEIADGAAVTCYVCIIGETSSSTGNVTVTGAGSNWTTNAALCIGSSGKGTANIAGGGTVSAASTSINAQSLLSIAVSGGSNLSIESGSGTLTNDGTVRVIAGAGPNTGASYTPISAGTWAGGGIYQALGGTWDETNHEFTVSQVVGGDSGTELSINLFEKQRILVEDITSGWSLGVSLLAMDSSTTVGFTATVIEEMSIDNLEALLTTDGEVLGAWDLVADGYDTEDPAYLSFGIDPSYSRDDLTVWYHDGAGWAEYDAMDLTCGEGYASFTVTGLDGVYAVTAVPEPATIALLLSLAAGMFLASGRRRS